MVMCYPNPFRSTATIKILRSKWNNLDKKVTIYDSGMKEVRVLPWMKNQPVLTFQKGNLSCGVFYLLVESSDNTVIGGCKIVVMD